MNQETTLYIDNMVCDRCKTAVRQISEQLGWRVKRLDLGRLTGIPPAADTDHYRLQQQLEAVGFTLRRDSRGVVFRIKGLIIRYVYDDVAHSSPTLSELIVRDIGQSYPHLSRLFRREEGRTIADYYRAQRMERAKRLLANSDEQVGLIAYRLHYGTAGRFTAVFRAETGMSPTRWRERGQYDPQPLDRL